jgi:hypothetical protein
MLNTRTLVQRNVAKVESLPAPVTGWNARDSYANMAPTDAITLENYFPTVSNVTLRGGSTNWATGLGGQVQTLMVYAYGNNTKMFAWTEHGDLYNVTSAGAVRAAVLSGRTNGYWEYTNITTSGGNYLICCNGVDKPLLYDGTTWTAIDGSSTPAITGVTTTKLANVTLFKNRLWFIEQYTLNAWYLPTSSIGGAAVKFDLGAIAKRGGHLVDFDSWTIDAGYGVDDNLAFVTSTGEVIIYSGTDPASITTWALIGVWTLGSPIGTRCMLKWAGDLLILTYDGLMPMAQSLQSSRLDPRVALSNKIQGAITAATTAYAGTHYALGWQIVYTAKYNAVWINVPVTVGTQQQYVMNTITSSWCNFTGWPANCWEIFNDEPYYGGNGVVVRAWDSTYADNGTNITGYAAQAFNYFGERGVKKYFTRVRPSIFTNGNPAISVGTNVDFDTGDNTAALSAAPLLYGQWDSGLWDSALWGADLSITNTWLGTTGIGYCASIQFKSASQRIQIQWASTDVVYQTGFAGV